MDDKNSLLIAIGRTICDLRKTQGISQEELADIAQLDRSYVGSVERGERNITIQTLQKFAEALGSSVTALVAPLQNPRISYPKNFHDDSVLQEAGITKQIIKDGLDYVYAVIDALDATLLANNADPMAETVELAGFSSLIGDLLASGIAVE